MDVVWPYLTAIVPTIAVAVLFYFLIRSMIEGDRRERLAQKQFEKQAERDRESAERAGDAGEPASSGDTTQE